MPPVFDRTGWSDRGDEHARVLVPVLTPAEARRWAWGRWAVARGLYSDATPETRRLVFWRWLWQHGGIDEAR